MRSRIQTLGSERADFEKRVTELEKQIANGSSALPTSTTEGAFSPSQIDEAVKTAVAARESELNTTHAKALEEAKASATSAGDSTAVSADTNSSVFETRLNEAVASAKDEAEKGKAELQGKVTDFEVQVKDLQRQIRNGEIARKTLERQKTDAQTRVKELEAQASSNSTQPPQSSAPVQPSASSSSMPPAGLTPSTQTPSTAEAGESKPSSIQIKQDGRSSGSATEPNVSAPTGPARGTPGRGRVLRGIARGAARGGTPRSNSILSSTSKFHSYPAPDTAAVNAQLAAASAAPSVPSPTSPSSNKRPLEAEDGEIPDSPSILSRIQGNAAATSPGGQRVIKRPRGGGPAGRGGRGGTPRRPSQQGATGEGGGGGDASGSAGGGGTAS